MMNLLAEHELVQIWHACMYMQQRSALQCYVPGPEVDRHQCAQLSGLFWAIAALQAHGRDHDQ